MIAPVRVAGEEVSPGTRADLSCAVSESYTGDRLSIPVAVFHGAQTGPRMFVTAAVHGDELNGVAACRELIQSLDPQRLRGTILIAPLVNILGVQLHSRYLPDRRDLNRAFPGSPTGSLAARIARVVLDEIVVASDLGVDLHTAANRRTNVPQVRIDTADPQTLRLAEAFGAPYILSAATRPGSLREVAADRGVPVLTFEGGEALRFDTDAIQVATEGILRLLHHLQMTDAAPEPPHDPPVVMHDSRWIRAERGGILDLQVGPGDQVRVGQTLWATTDPFGHERSAVDSPDDGVVIGATTLPLVSPGDAVLHVGLVGERPPHEDDPSEEEDQVEDDHPA